MASPAPPPPDSPFWIVDRINYIVRFFLDPCDAPLSAWAEAFRPAALNFLISYYLFFDPKQILTGAVRPSVAMARQKSNKKGNRGPKSNKGKKPGIAKKIATFDANEATGKFLGNWFEQPSRKVSSGVVTLWLFEGLIERALFWFMILDLLTEFLYQWLGAIQEGRFCQARESIVLLTDGPSHQFIGLQPDEALPMPLIQKQRGDVEWNMAAGIVQYASGNVTVTTSVRGNLPFPIQARLCIRAGGTPSGAILAQTITTINGIEPQVMTVTHNFTGTFIFNVTMWCDSFGIICENSTLHLGAEPLRFSRPALPSPAQT